MFQIQKVDVLQPASEFYNYPELPKQCVAFFMIVLTSNNPKQDFQHLKHKIATERFSLTHVTLFSTKFVNCQLQLVEIEADIFVQTLADLAWLLKVWQIGNNLDVNCEKLSIWCDGIDYGWLFQLVKKKSFDSNCISNAMDQMKFDRSKLYWIEGVLSNGAKERNSERQPNVKQNKIDIKVGLSDSRCELIKLIDIFCHSLNLYGIVTRSLVIEVEMDNNEWAFFKFLLTRRKTTIVINDVVVIFPENATEESRMVAIEVITIPKKLIQDRCKEEGISVCDVSPIIFIDQAEKIPYAEPVHVYLPCPSVSEDYETQIFSKHPPEISDWELVKEWSEVRYGGKSKLLYKSKIFSPVNGVTQKKSDRKVNPGLFSNPQQANVAYATITALEHRPGNVVFDCVRAKNDNYMQLLKVSPYTEVREVGPMHKKDKLLAYLRGDFAVERPKLKNNNMIEFSCPDCVSNQQEYKMKKIEGNGDSLGIVDYVLQSKKGRTDLFHMFYQMPTNIVYPRSTSSTNSELERPHYSHKFQDEPWWKVHLESAMFRLCNDVQNPRQICVYLISCGEMTEVKEEEVKRQWIRFDQNRELIRHVISRGFSAYKHFRNALIELEEANHLIQLLPEMKTRLTPQENGRGVLNNTNFSDDSFQIADEIEAGPSTSS